LGRVEKSIEIGAPPEKVWEILALDRFLEWDEGTQKNAKRVEYTSEVGTPKDKYRVGATANFIDKHDKVFLTCEVTESLENEKITYRTSMFIVHRIDLTYVLEPVEEGTKLTYVINYEMIGWWILGKILVKLMVWSSGKEIERSLEKLKSILEK